MQPDESWRPHRDRGGKPLERGIAFDLPGWLIRLKEITPDQAGLVGPVSKLGGFHVQHPHIIGQWRFRHLCVSWLLDETPAHRWTDGDPCWAARRMPDDTPWRNTRRS